MHLHKFCGKCCKRIRDKRELDSHYKVTHAGVMSHYLQFDSELPLASEQCYTNFAEYLAAPSQVGLVSRMDMHVGRGRPKKQELPYMDPDEFWLDPMVCYDDNGLF